jgi:hypothetical protein
MNHRRRMEQLITHACGHEQAHHLTGFASQQERKVRWLRTTTCRPCFIAGRKAEQAQAAERDGAAIAHLDLPALVGSDRQVGWATTIRAGRMAALVTASATGEAVALHRLTAITEAKWWIDHRDLTDAELVATVSQAAGMAQRVDHDSEAGIRSQAA